MRVNIFDANGQLIASKHVYELLREQLAEWALEQAQKGYKVVHVREAGDDKPALEKPMCITIRKPDGSVLSVRAFRADGRIKYLDLWIWGLVAQGYEVLFSEKC